MSKTFPVKAELHVHSNQGYRMAFFPCLYDSVMTAMEVVEQCLAKDIKILALTDHDTTAGSKQAAQIVKNRGLDILVITSCEVSSKDGHILAYNIQKDIPSGKTAKETVDRIHDQGGLAVAAHPYNFIQGVKDLVRELDFDGMEVFNSSIWHTGNMRSWLVAQELGLPGIAGSDAHWVDCIGTGITLFPEGTNTIDKVITCLKTQNIKLDKRKNDMLVNIPKYFGKNFQIKGEELIRMLQLTEYEKAG